MKLKKEDEQYFQGPFWIISDSVKNIYRGIFKIIGEKYLCDYSGDYFNTLSKSQRTHKKLWDTYKTQYNNVDFDYFPRGRVSIYMGTAFIHLNSKCNIPKIIDSVIKDYHLEKLEIEINLNDTYQGSHYDFKLT